MKKSGLNAVDSVFFPEKLKNFELLHGECVAIGMVAAAYLSCLRGYITKEQLVEITETIRDFGLPVTVSGMKAEDIVSACRHDKKMDGKHIKFILLKQVGEAFIDTSITQEELFMAAEYVLTESNKASTDGVEPTLKSEI